MTARLDAASKVVAGLDAAERAQLAASLVADLDVGGTVLIGRSLAERLLDLAQRDPAAVSAVVGALTRLVRDLAVGLTPLPVAPLVDEAAAPRCGP